MDNNQEGSGETQQSPKKGKRSSSVVYTKELFERLDKRLSKYEVMKNLEEKTGVHKTRLAIAGMVVGAFLLVWLFSFAALCDTLAFVYPCYKSFKALRSQDADEHTFWLTYWVVYGLFDLVEIVCDAFLAWFPFYAFSKGVFLICCFHSRIRLCVVIYDLVIRPLFRRSEDSLDRLNEEIQSRLKHLATEIFDVLLAKVRPDQLLSGVFSVVSNLKNSSTGSSEEADKDESKRKKLS